MNSTRARIGEFLRSLLTRKTITVVSIALVLIALPLTVYLGQQRQDIRQRASDGQVCRQGEFTDLAAADQMAVYCLSTDPYCIVQGSVPEQGGSQFQGSRPILRNEAIALIARYHVQVLRDWLWTTSGAQRFIDVPPSSPFYKEIQTAAENPGNNPFIRGYDNGDGSFSFDPDQEWKFGMSGVNKGEYNFAAPGGSISRSQFVQSLYDYGSRNGQLAVCNPQTVTRCSTTKGCTRATFQSVDGGVHPLPNTTTYTTDTSCGPVAGGDNSACPVATTPPLPNPACSGVTPEITVTSDPNRQIIIRATGVTDTQSIKFPTWSEVAGQDDIVWYPGTDAGNGVWQTAIPLQTHTKGNVNTGKIITHVYIYNTTQPGGVICGTTEITVKPTTYSISGAVTGTTTPVTVSARTSAGAAPTTVQSNANGFYQFTGLAAGYYTLSVTTASGQTVTPVNYGITVGSSCSIIPAGTNALCGTDNNVTRVNFALATLETLAAPTNLQPSTTIPAGDKMISWNAVSGATAYEMALQTEYDNTLSMNIPGCITIGDYCVITFPETTRNYNFLEGRTYTIRVRAIKGTGTSAIRSDMTTTRFTVSAPVATDTLLSVSFKQHGIGNASDNANPNAGTQEVFPIPVAPFKNRDVTVYLSKGLIQNDGNLVYDYKKAGTVIYAADNSGLYTGTINLGSTVPAGQYIVAIQTSNSLSQQSNGYIAIGNTPTVNVTFPALINGNAYDSTIDNASPTNVNQLDILDYNAVMDNWLTPDICTNKTGTQLTTCQTIKTRSDFNADGAVDVLDYNLLIRELSVQRGR